MQDKTRQELEKLRMELDAKKHWLEDEMKRYDIISKMEHNLKQTHLQSKMLQIYVFINMKCIALTPPTVHSHVKSFTSYYQI